VADFGALLPAEARLVEACRLGEVANVGPERPENKTKDNEIRASVLRFLSLGGDAETPIHERGVQLAGAWIEGPWDLSGAEIPCDLHLLRCTFADPITLRYARLSVGFNLAGCRAVGIAADGIRAFGTINFSSGFTSEGEVSLVGAQIGASLACNGGSFDGNGGQALSAESAVVMGSVFLDNVTAKGVVRLVGAQIGAYLQCNHGSFDGNGGQALSVDNAVVTGSVFLDSVSAKGEVRLLYARIGASLQCCRGSFDGNGGKALAADGVMVKGAVFLDDGFSSMGEVRLVRAQIGAYLKCNGGSFDGNGEEALAAEGVVVKGAVSLGKGFTSKGGVDLTGAQITGDLFCMGGSFEPGASQTGLDLRGARVDGSFRVSASAPVQIDLRSATVVDLYDDEDTWGKGLYLDGFRYEAFVGSAPTSAVARLRWLDHQVPSHAGLEAGTREFRPQPWRQLQKVLLEMGHAEEARQVAIAFERRLRTADLIGEGPKHWSWLRRTANRFVARAAHRVFGALTGYGHRPARLLAFLLALWLLGGVWYWFAASRLAVFAPTDPIVFQSEAYVVCRPDNPNPGNWYHCPALREEYSGLSPWAFSLDALLPIVDLHQERTWGPLIPTAKAGFFADLLFFDWKHVTRLLIWFQTLFGWVASLLLVAIVSGLARRRETL